MGREASIGKGGQTEECPQEDLDYISTCETITVGCVRLGGSGPLLAGTINEELVMIT